MIRINLIGTKVKPRARAPSAQLYLYLALFLVEGIFLFVWHQMLVSDLESATAKAKEAVAKVETLKKVKESWEQWQVEKADLDRQARVFESLRAGQVGPPNMLQYLSYALSRTPDSPAFSEEIKAQELVGWNPRWDAGRLWLRRLEEKGGMLTLYGEAADHEDVAEFYRRLDSSDFFTDVEPGLQVRKVSPELGIKFVDFTVTAGLQYRPPEDNPMGQGAPAQEGPARLPELKQGNSSGTHGVGQAAQVAARSSERRSFTRASVPR